MNILHIAGIVLRNFLLLRHSWHRAFSLFYWTTLELFLWGFVTLWLKSMNPDGKINFVLILLGALIFWDLFSRAQQTIAVSFLEDIWSRNIINLFASPVTVKEFVVGFILLSIFQGLLSFGLVALLAWIFYALHIWSLGFYLLPFFLNIFVFGWGLGFFTIGLVIRFGPSVEVLAWSIPVLFQPLSAVFYPVNILPVFFQKIAFFIPTMHLFEGMRSVLASRVFPLEQTIFASILSIPYFVFGTLFFYWMLRVARKRGLLGRFITE